MMFLNSLSKVSVGFRLCMLTRRATYVQHVRRLSTQDKTWGWLSDYNAYKEDRKKALNDRLYAKNRFQRISEREDRTELTADTIKTVCLGKFFIHHRGCQLLKTPNDMIILQELLWNLRPQTVIELGAFTGGSAVWMSDTLRLMEVETRILSMDISLSKIEDRVKEINPENVTFIEGDSFKIEKSFPHEILETCPHPWLVIEDAHANMYGVMEYFHPYMKTGDYFIVEDLNPNIPSRQGFNGVYKEDYVASGPEGVEELKKFLTSYNNEYAVDSFYTDFFGYNGTYNMHGFIRRM